ncbi:RNA recognition motif domain-containing protein [Kistimonas asteriae]|uniref:RNA recognition motif domain-containing protein n=1 Tax=Kistimonas asteriae TaxID=517724 RepID=UPI001BA6EEFD|nr:RNA-binding protein [Kistimonas asteriae]
MQRKKLFVGNLDFSVTDADLMEAFSAFGTIEEARVITDHESGRSRGFAFVTFSTEESAESALTLDGQALNGRDMRVSIATERSKNDRGNGGRGGPGGRKRF